MSFIAVDPATGERIAEVPFESSTSVEQKIAAAHAAHLEWRLQSIEDRIQPLLEIGRLLRERKDDYGALMTREMGKPISQGWPRPPSAPGYATTMRNRHPAC